MWRVLVSVKPLVKHSNVLRRTIITRTDRRVEGKLRLKEWVDGGPGWVGLQKLITDLDMRNGYKWGVRVGLININDMYNNNVGKGGMGL